MHRTKLINCPINRTTLKDLAELEHNEWAGTTYGNNWMHRSLIKVLKMMDIRILYLFVYLFVVPPTLIINRKARKITYQYFRKRHNYGVLKSAWYTYKNQCVFGRVIVDKFASYAGKRFEFEIDNYDKFRSLADSKEGFVQLSSHIGNYEMAGYSLRSETKPFNAVVFGGEKGSVMENRRKLFESNNIRMITMREDMGHVYDINTALGNGEILSMPADRVFGSQKTFRMKFLNGHADFPQGPFVMAAVRDVPMLFVAVMKENAKSYHIIIEQLDKVEGSTRQKAERLAQQYVDILERTVRQYPEQWFNYYEFWTK